MTSIFSDPQILISSFGWAWARASFTGLTKQLDFDDVRQEFYEKVCRLQKGTGRFDPSKSAAGTYLKMIATQSILREKKKLSYRGRGKTQVGATDDITLEEMSILPVYLEEKEDHLDHPLLRSYLAKMDDRDQFLLMKVAEEGTTYSDLGIELGLSRERTRKLYLRAIDRLRVLMGVN